MTQTDKEKLRMAKNLVKANNKKIKKALQKIDEFENSGTRDGRQAPLPSVIIAWIKEIKKILEK